MSYESYVPRSMQPKLNAGCKNFAHNNLITLLPFCFWPQSLQFYTFKFHSCRSIKKLCEELSLCSLCLQHFFFYSKSLYIVGRKQEIPLFLEYLSSLPSLTFVRQKVQGYNCDVKHFLSFFLFYPCSFCILKNTLCCTLWSLLVLKARQSILMHPHWQVKVMSLEMWCLTGESLWSCKLENNVLQL